MLLPLASSVANLLFAGRFLTAMGLCGRSGFGAGVVNAVGACYSGRWLATHLSP